MTITMAAVLVVNLIYTAGIALVGLAGTLLWLGWAAAALGLLPEATPSPGFDSHGAE